MPNTKNLRKFIYTWMEYMDTAIVNWVNKQKKTLCSRLVSRILVCGS